MAKTKGRTKPREEVQEEEETRTEKAQNEEQQPGAKRKNLLRDEKEEQQGGVFELLAGTHFEPDAKGEDGIPGVEYHRAPPSGNPPQPSEPVYVQSDRALDVIFTNKFRRVGAQTRKPRDYIQHFDREDTTDLPAHTRLSKDAPQFEQRKKSLAEPAPATEDHDTYRKRGIEATEPARNRGPYPKDPRPEEEEKIRAEARQEGTPQENEEKSASSESSGTEDDDEEPPILKKKRGKK